MDTSSHRRNHIADQFQGQGEIQMPLHPRAMGLMSLLAVSLIASCSSLNVKKEYFGTPDRKNQHRYITNGVPAPLHG